ncbi:MAG: HpcH/HpaI aldolase/citrate lyase family protein, partial [Promethearchaeia archaeon]
KGIMGGWRRASLTRVRTLWVRTLCASAASEQLVRPRRSVLFMPGSNAKAVNKARSLPADVVVLDLEDAVAPAVKAQARGMVLTELHAGGFGPRELAVRANGLDTQWAEEDLAMVARSGAHAVAIPKVERGETVERVRAILESYNAPSQLAIWSMIETPLGVLRAEEICVAGKGDGNAAAPCRNPMTAVIMGTSDLTKELRAQHTPCRSALTTSLQLVMLAARSHGMLALDGVNLDFRNTEELREHCQAACSPNQVVTAKRQTTKMRGHPHPVCATARKRDAGAKSIPAHTCQGHSARRAECNRLGGGSAWNAAQPH